MNLPSRPLLGPGPALALLLAGIVAVNISRTAVVPESWHFPYNVTIALYAMVIAFAAGLRVEDLGLSPSAVPAGLRLGAIAFTVVSAVVIMGGFLGVVNDDRVDPSSTAMLVRVLLIIPIGTVAVEELLFRSALHGLLSKLVSPAWSIALGAALFGLWHVFPASQGDAVSSDAVQASTTLTLLGTLVATTAAGYGFIWLRNRSGSVVAPVLAHLATNSVTYFVAWLASTRA